jgi:type VI protein secretion system component Hcp
MSGSRAAIAAAIAGLTPPSEHHYIFSIQEAAIRAGRRPNMNRTFARTAALLLVATAFLAQAVPAQANGFLKVSGVAGDSKDMNHKGWIDVLSFSWAGRAPANGSGPGSLTIVMRTGKSSSSLRTKAGAGQKVPEVVFEAAGTGTDGKPGTFVYKMTDVAIGSYDTSGSGSNGQESVSFNYRKVSWTYTAQK